MIHLYVKTHNTTGLKYLGKTTSKNPSEYKGSGKRWLNHIKTHGYDVTTEIIHSSESKEDIIDLGIKYSELWNVVESDEWANLKIECGDGVTSKEASIENNKRLKSGSHPFCDPDFNKRTKDKRNETRRKNGSHNFLGGSVQKKRIENGTHHFLGGDVQRKSTTKMVEDGRHPMQQGLVNVVDENGIKHRIPKEEYAGQSRMVHVNSKEGRIRLGKSILFGRQKPKA